MYQVKFTKNGITKYGIIDDYSLQAKKAKENGLSIVCDAITPEVYTVETKDLTEIPLDSPIWNKELDTWIENEYDEFVTREFYKARDLSESLQKLDVGSLFSVPITDGCAWYVVTKLNKKTCQIEWRGFSLDRWVDNVFGYGGTFPLDLVTRFVNRNNMCKPE